MVVNFIDSVGIYILNKLNSIGEFGFFIIRFLSVFLRKPINKRQLIQQMYIIQKRRVNDDNFIKLFRNFKRDS